MENKNETKNHPYESGEMEITLPINIDDNNDLPDDITQFCYNLRHYSEEIREEYGNVFSTLVYLTIKVNTKKNISRKLFHLLVIISDCAGKQTRRERDLFLTPEQESYFFKKALCQITENYLNIMENSAVCPMACPKK